MKYSAALILAAVAVGVSAQGEAIGKAPPGGSPPGCITNGNGYYQITVVQPAGTPAKRDLETRQAGLPACGPEGTLIFRLDNGVLTDSQGRIGSIVANRQFQFDGPPPQTGSIYTGGFSVCGNTSLALGPTTNFYQCLSGGFYNLYDQPSESACRLVKFNTQNCNLNRAGTGSSVSSVASSAVSTPASTASASLVSQQTDGQPTASRATTAVVSQQPDGQPTASSAAVVTQISDGQLQASGATNATITSARPSAPIATGAAAQFLASGAVAALGAAAALFL